MKELLEKRLIVEKGDITKQKTDAIVNAANSSLLGGGGVDGAIHRSGGPAILDECKKIRSEQYPNGLPAGQAVITSAGLLSAKHVIHTVGPVWHGGGSNEDETLVSAYKNSLALAAKKGLKSISFPAISTGVYGFPKERAAKLVYKTIKDYLAHNELPEKVYLVFFSGEDYDIFTKTVGEE